MIYTHSDSRAASTIRASLSLIVVSLLLLLLSADLYAQQRGGRGRGGRAPMVVRITNTKGAPIADLAIVLKERPTSRITDDDGVADFGPLPHGTYTLSIQGITIDRTIRTVEHKPQQGRRPITLHIQEQDIDLEEVVVMGTSMKQKIETSGFACEVVKPDELSKFSLSTTEILDRLPGMRIRQSGGLGSRANININGMSGSAIRTFINGIPQSNYGGSFSLRSIPASMIERVEVYKGVVPAHLSEDALGGAVNIVLKENAQNQLSMSYSIGSFHTHLANVYGSLSLGKGITASVSSFFNYSKNDYLVWGEGIDFVDYMGNVTAYGTRARRFHDGYRDAGVRLGLSIRSKPWADQLTLNAIYTNGYKEIQHGAKMNVVYGNRHRRSNTTGMELSYRKADLLIDGMELDAFAGYNRSQRTVVDTIPYRYDWSGRPILRPNGTPVSNHFGAEVRNGITGGPSVQTDYTNAVIGRLGLGYTFAEHHTARVRTQLNYFWQDSHEAMMPKGVEVPDRRQSNLKWVTTLSEESSWLGGRLKTTLFGKHFANTIHTRMTNTKGEYLPISRATDHFGFGGSVSYRLVREFYIHASAEKAVRLPSEAELFGNVTNNVEASVNLRAERSNNFNLGFSTGAYRFGKWTMSGALTLFVRDTRDMIRERVASGTITDFTSFENIESVLTQGFDSELMLRYRDRLTLSGSFSLFDGRFNTRYDDYGMPHSHYGLPLKNEPSQKGNLNATLFFPNLFRSGNTLTLGANLNYVNKFSVDWIIYGSEAQGKVFIPRQTPIDLSVSYSMIGGRLTLSADAKNILNQQLFDNMGLQKPGRALYAKVTYSLR